MRSTTPGCHVGAVNTRIHRLRKGAARVAGAIPTLRHAPGADPSSARRLVRWGITTAKLEHASRMPVTHMDLLPASVTPRDVTFIGLFVTGLKNTYHIITQARAHPRASRALSVLQARLGDSQAPQTCKACKYTTAHALKARNVHLTSTVPPATSATPRASPPYPPRSPSPSATSPAPPAACSSAVPPGARLRAAPSALRPRHARLGHPDRAPPP